jgi:Raf kinase inhibitor-like YbhB/YbcL family protein
LKLVFTRALGINAVAAGALLASSPVSGADLFSADSSDLPAGAAIPQRFTFNGYGCKGQNVSPAIAWNNPPADTKSFALLVHDPDAPTGGKGWWHWIVVDIPGSSRALAQGAGTADGKALPAPARQLSNDFGAPGWGGPCPPAGDRPHHYVFTVYAVRVDKLNLPANATGPEALSAATSNALAKAAFVRQFGR